METAMQVAPALGVAVVCLALGLSRASYYRRRKTQAAAQPRPTPARALSARERQAVLETLHSKRFVDRSPAEVWSTLLSAGVYLCSVRSMYRILADNREVRERRDQLRHPSYSKPELVARGPNEVWSWDITKLKGPAKWEYFYLYVILDIYSRYVVGWMVAEHENAQLAARLIRETYDKQGVQTNTLVLHADRGSPMKANTTVQLLASLGVVRSHSRPHVSNDNPYSESQFKTLKYHPEFPRRFGAMSQALAFSRSFFGWYNNEHAHSGLQYLTPAQVHHGEAEAALRHRHAVLFEAYERHPDRFVAGPPQRPRLPEAVWINPPRPDRGCEGVGVPVTPGAEPGGASASAGGGRCPNQPLHGGGDSDSDPSTGLSEVKQPHGLAASSTMQTKESGDKKTCPRSGPIEPVARKAHPCPPLSSDTRLRVTGTEHAGQRTQEVLP